MIPDHLLDTGYQWCLMELVREHMGDQHVRLLGQHPGVDIVE
jgi:hypothetical protein